MDAITALLEEIRGNSARPGRRVVDALEVLAEVPLAMAEAAAGRLTSASHRSCWAMILEVIERPGDCLLPVQLASCRTGAVGTYGGGRRGGEHHSGRNQGAGMVMVLTSSPYCGKVRFPQRVTVGW